uniref:Uncharacterized protein n=1 Tax=Schizophyllum commune (strain H4-8 / FGSC 9210) TaxID=578458 RepID=D8QAI4_SCHCM
MTAHPLAPRSLACHGGASSLWQTSRGAVAILGLRGRRLCHYCCTTTAGRHRHLGPHYPYHHPTTPSHSPVQAKLYPSTTRGLQNGTCNQCHTIAPDLPTSPRPRQSRKASTSPRAVMARRQAELAGRTHAAPTAGPSGKRTRAPDEGEGSPQKRARKTNADGGIITFKHDRPVRRSDVFDEGSSFIVEEMLAPADDDDGEAVGWDADSDAPAVGSPARFEETWSPQSLGHASAGLVEGSSSPVVTAERLLQRAQGLEDDEVEWADENEVPRPMLERIPGPPLIMPWEAVSPVVSAGDLDDEERSVGWPNGTQRPGEEHVIRQMEGVHDEGDGPFDDIYAEEYGATNAAPEEDEGEYFEYDKEPFEQEDDVEAGRGEHSSSTVRPNEDSPFTRARPSNRDKPRDSEARFLLSPLVAPASLPPPVVFEEHLAQAIPTPLKTDNPRKFHALFPDQEPTSPDGLLRQLRLTQAEVGRLELIEVRWEHAFHEALREMGRQNVQLREQEERLRKQEETMAENEMVVQGAQVVQQQMAEERAELQRMVDVLEGLLSKVERERDAALRKQADELEEMRALLEETRRERDEARQQIATMTSGSMKRKGSPCEDEARDPSEQETRRSPKKMRGSPQARLVYHGSLLATEA